MSRLRVLVVDDDPSIRFGVRGFLEARDCEVEEAGTCAAAEERLRGSLPDVVVADYRLPDGSALDLLPRFREQAPGIPFLILTAHGSIDLAVRAIQAGADQFLTKPVELPALLVLIRRLDDQRRLRERHTAGESRRNRGLPDPFLGGSPAIRELESAAGNALASASPILLLGETGTGKGVLASWIHRNGPRAGEPFMDLNCAGLAREFLESELFGHEKGAFTGATGAKPGLLEVADRGTLFLDEIGDMDPAVQGKVLKVLEEKRFRRMGDVRERRVDVRIIAATHRDLPALVRERRFREDLYYRIGVLPLRIPPLRERAGDLAGIARRILSELAHELDRPDLRLGESAELELQSYPWPGNIRELRNALERAALRSPTARVESLHLEPVRGADSPSEPAADLTLEELERRHIARVLREEGGHVERASKRLGIPRSSLYTRIRKLGIPSGR
jgi:DNA-binding NtrC family response regulator